MSTNKQILYTPKDTVEEVALDMALLAGSLYRTNDAELQEVYFKVIQKNPDGTFAVEQVRL